eukprot:5580193-Amphidinium_carterae.1
MYVALPRTKQTKLPFLANHSESVQLRAQRAFEAGFALACERARQSKARGRKNWPLVCYRSITLSHRGGCLSLDTPVLASDVCIKTPPKTSGE